MSNLQNTRSNIDVSLQELVASLTESERRLANAQKLAHIGNWDLDLVNNSLYWSDEIYRIFGLDKQHIPAYETFLNAVHPADRPAWEAHREMVINKGITMNMEHRIVLPDGTIRYVCELGERVVDDKNRPLWLRGTVQDITETKLTSLRVKESENRFRSLVQNGADLIGVLDAYGIYNYVSPTVTPILGYDAESLIGKNAFSFIHPEDASAVSEQYGLIMDKNYLELAPYRFLDNKGNWRWIETKLTNLMNDINIRGIVANSRDITETKEVKDTLKILSLIAKETSNAVIISDTAGNISWVNNAFTRITGYKAEEVKGKKPGSFLQGKDTDATTIRYLRKKIRNCLPFHCEILNYNKMGLPYWIEIHGESIFDANGECTQHFAIQSDITDRKNAEKKVRDSEREYRYLFQQNPMPMWIFDQESLYFLEVNEAAVYHYKYSVEEFQKMRITDIRPSSEISLLEKRIRDWKNSKGIKELSIWKHLKKNGEIIFVEITSHNIDYQGKTAILVLANDVTEKIQLQKKLDRELVLKQREITEAVVDAQEKEKLELGKELHDNVNQILGAAKLYITSARSNKGKTGEMINTSAELLTLAIDEIRKLSKSLAGHDIDTLHLCEAIDNLSEQLMASAPLSISFSRQTFTEDDLSKKLKLNIFRIVQEQFNNIIKHAHASEVFISLERDAAKLSLFIQDNGRGFDSSQTRNGIGINNIYNRASLNDGKVSIESAPGKGCRLMVEFMLHPAL